MMLEFKFERPQASIAATMDALQISLCNPSIGSSLERWDLGPAVYRKQGNIHSLRTENFLIGALSLPVTPDTLSKKTNQAYREIFELSRPYNLFRFWNFVPDINYCPDNGLENYQSFCQGRSIAFEENIHLEASKSIPAGSAVGTMDDHLTIIFSCGSDSSRHLENPRQTPAYQYPERYGPRPPAFSRATSVTNKTHPLIYISGTASVIGSESVGQTVEEQLTVTLENLAIIEKNARETAEFDQHERRQVRVYLRDSKDYAYVSEVLNQEFLRKNDSITYVVAEICRKELLVEIEVTLGA